MASTHHDAASGVFACLFQGVDVDPLAALSDLTANDFPDPFLRRLFACCKAMLEDGKPLIIGAIVNKMKLDVVEMARLDVFMDRLLVTRQPGELASHALRVKRAACERNLKKVCDDVVSGNGDIGLVVKLHVTLEKYFASLREAIDPPGILASTVTPKTVKWFWRGYIPLGKPTVGDGDPDEGKSVLSIDLAARSTSGRSMPDGTPGATGGALLISAEDDADDTITPRLIAAGADLTRTRILRTIKTGDGERQIEIPADIPAIREAALSVDAVLIVIDPLMAFLAGGTNTWRDQDVRRALEPLARLAAELGAAVLVIRHLNKSSEGNPLYRGGGSIGIIGAARAGFVVGKDPDDGTGETRVLAVTKSNLAKKAPSLRYRIEPCGNSVAIKWLGESEHRATTLLAAPEGEQRSAVEECRRFIVGFLEDSAQPASEVMAAAHKAGFTDRTIDRAKIRANVEAYRSGFGKDGKWTWNIPAKGANT
jgi:hypothetical protein